jgi:hypothetical protein
VSLAALPGAATHDKLLLDEIAVDTDVRLPSPSPDSGGTAQSCAIRLDLIRRLLMGERESMQYPQPGKAGIED